jgi:OmpA-OmpF porin, OOP family
LAFTKKISALGAAMTVALLASAGAQAQGAYVGGALGKTQFSEQDCAADCTTSENGGKLVAGYRFASGWALEGTYFRFGKYRESGVIGSTPYTASVTADGLAFGGAYTFMNLDSSPVNATVRLGVSANKVKASASAVGVTVSESETKVRPYVGLAVGYAVTKNVNIDLGVDWTRWDSSDADVKVRARLVSLGATYSF